MRQNLNGKLFVFLKCLLYNQKNKDLLKYLRKHYISKISLSKTVPQIKFQVKHEEGGKKLQFKKLFFLIKHAF